jgi:hypothetical protein
VTGFSVRKTTRQDKKNGAGAFQQMLVVLGGGTELATCAVSYGTAEKIEAWIRAHPAFCGNVPQNAAASQGAVQATFADEFVKLAQLRDAGAQSPEEFAQAKAKLLN